ncbi:DUF6192 family protein [Kitasatospora sp. NPDC093806]|uniref:DUF6192 family protein n=1 Tax=Kitasatospora sp. NPDC093806 TaxID=3155075 RepID=UPI003420D2DF
MPENVEIEKADKIGNVSIERYAEIVAELRKLVETASRIQFTVGDYALEVEPMREQGGSGPAEELFTVKDSLFRLAEDIGLSYSQLKTDRWTSSKWPKERRQAGVSFTVHRILARIEDEEERFAAILTPPDGKARWTPDEAKRRVGWQVAKPVTPQEKVSAIHSLAQDEEVAATVTGDFLRRPAVVAQVKPEDKVRVVEELTRDDEVAAAVAPEFLRRPAVVARVAPAEKMKVVEELTRDDHVAAQVTTGLLRRPDVAARAMADDTARHQVNHAQVERGRQAREHFEQNSPIAPAIRRIDRSVEFLDLVTACHAFVAAAGRAVPGLRDRQLSSDEKAIVHERIAACRATLDWIETAVDTGKVDVDSELARLLTGEYWDAPGLRPQVARRRTARRHRPQGPLRGPSRGADLRPAHQMQ